MIDVLEDRAVRCSMARAPGSRARSRAGALHTHLGISWGLHVQILWEKHLNTEHSLSYFMFILMNKGVKYRCEKRSLGA